MPFPNNASRVRNYARGRIWQRERQHQWVMHEIELITAKPKLPDRELARLLGVSVQAIQLTRHRYKR
jgi:hypothetical protein